jgi:hypothetical protein
MEGRKEPSEINANLIVAYYLNLLSRANQLSRSRIDLIKFTRTTFYKVYAGMGGSFGTLSRFRSVVCSKESLSESYTKKNGYDMRPLDMRASDGSFLVVAKVGRGGAGSPLPALRLPHASLSRSEGLVFISTDSI